MPKWITENLPHAIVVRPLEDSVLHTRTVFCVCKPTQKIEVGTCVCYSGRPTMSIKKIIIHNTVEENKWLRK